MVQSGRLWQKMVPSGLWGWVRLAIAIPWLTVLLTIGAAGGALWYTVGHLALHTSRNALVPEHARYMRSYRASREEFGTLDNMIVVVEPPHVERGKQFVDALAARLEADTQHFMHVTARLDTAGLEGKKLLLLSPADLRTLTQRLQDAQMFISEVTTNPGLQPLLSAINREISKALVEHITGEMFKSSTADAASTPATDTAAPTLDVSFLSALFTEMAQALEHPSTYLFSSPWNRFFLKDSSVLSSQGYLTARNDHFLFVLVEDRPGKDSFVEHAGPLQALRAHIAALREDFPDVQAGVTGGVALAADEMLASQRDTTVATVLALVGISALFMVTFRERRRPLLVVGTLAVAVCWTLGLTAATIGRLNILSIAFTPILLGLGIDFGIHLLARYAEERASGQAFRPALLTTCQHTGPGIAAAALTTALAFYAVLLVDFPGLAELGFITGSGVLLCLLASFTLLPALLALSEGHRQVQAGVWQSVPPHQVHVLKRFPRSTLLALAGLTLAGLYLLPLPQFDYNLLNLQAHGTESVIWEYRLLEGSGRSSWYATSVADSLDELHRKRAAFRALPVVDRVESLSSLLPADQDARLALIQQLSPWVDPIVLSTAPQNPIKLDNIQTVLNKIRFKLQKPDTAWDPQKRPDEADLSAARAALLALQKRLGAVTPEAAINVLTAFQVTLWQDFADKLQLLQRNAHPAAPITLADVPPYLRERFVGKHGRYLLQIFARENIWERQPMAAFVTQLQAVDPDVTGAPVVGYYSIRQMQHGYTYSGWYAFGVIAGVTFLLFRRLKPTLLALLPLLLGALWTVLGMSLLQVHFNMANLIILPLFLGIAIDSGIHLVHRALENPEVASAPMARSTGKAVLLSALTTIVGFASLLVARHVGIFSLGLLSTLAISSSLMAAFIALPLILQLLPLGPSAPTPAGTLSPPVQSGTSSPS